MSRIYEDQLKLIDGNYTNFEDYMNRRTIATGSFGSPHSVTLGSASDFKLLDAPTHLSAGVIAKNAVSNVGVASQNGGLVAAALVGLVGTAANTNVSASNGDILNIVDLKEGGTNNDVILTILGTDRKVYGLIQCSNTVTDGDAIGASGSENVQISFVYYDSSYVLTLANLPAGTYDFQINSLYTERFMPNLRKESGTPSRDVLDLKSVVANYLALYEVTTEFPANDVIDIATGAGTTGVSTPSGDSVNIAFPTLSSDFDSNARVIILRNGVEQVKGTGKDVVYNSSTSFHFTVPIHIGESIVIKTPQVYT